MFPRVNPKIQRSFPHLADKKQGRWPGPHFVDSSSLIAAWVAKNNLSARPYHLRLSRPEPGLRLAGNFDISTIIVMKANPMTSEDAVAALSSLAQEHRLAIFRLLVRAGQDGKSAGAIAEELSVPPSSLSFHLAHLARAGLVVQERQSRHLIYRADYAAMNRLIAYLLENCCSGGVCAVDVEKLLGAFG